MRRQAKKVKQNIADREVAEKKAIQEKIELLELLGVKEEQLSDTQKKSSQNLEKIIQKAT